MGFVLRKEHTGTRSRNKSKTWYGLDDLAAGFNGQSEKKKKTQDQCIPCLHAETVHN